LKERGDTGGEVMKIDMNLLPPEQRPKRWALPLTAGLIVLILAASYYGYGFYGRNVSAQDGLEQLQSQLDSVNAEIQEVIKESPIKDYEQHITEAQAEVDRLGTMEKDYETRSSERIYWKPVLQWVRELAPSDVELLEFKQNDNEITVDGELSSEVHDAIVVVEYAQQLEKRGIFSRIAFEIGSEERQTGEDNKTEEFFIFTMLLEIKPGGP
jgi:hypothetical protein